MSVSVQTFGGKDAAHLLIQIQFAGLPADARILMAGAGTGAEARYLAARFPGWHFTLIDPSAPMLAVAKRHAEAEGFAERCTFIADYVAGAPLDAHDAATSLLVSHFLTETETRQSFFEDIAARLKPGGLLFNLDLCADRQAATFPEALDLWLGILEQSGVPEEMRANWVSSFGRVFGIYPACPGFPGRDDARVDGGETPAPRVSGGITSRPTLRAASAPGLPARP
jgi:tRNA (cmo5U34)-methyltransferase